MAAKREATREARKERAEIIRMKHLEQVGLYQAEREGRSWTLQAREVAAKSERAVAIHRASLEAKLQVGTGRGWLGRALRSGESGEREKTAYGPRGSSAETSCSVGGVHEMVYLVGVGCPGSGPS